MKSTIVLAFFGVYIIRWLRYVGQIIVGFAVFGVFSTLCLSQYGGGNSQSGIEFQDQLSINITVPSTDGFAVFINTSMPVCAQVTDTLKKSSDGGQTWYDYSGSGITALPAYSVLWSADIGSFADEHSSATTYIAPGYSGWDEHDIAITATASEQSSCALDPSVSLGADVAPANPVDAVRKGGGFAFKVVADQTGSVGDAKHPFTWAKAANGKPAPDDVGGGVLGWLIPNTPALCSQYGGGTYLSVTKTANAPAQNVNLAWPQQALG